MSKDKEEFKLSEFKQFVNNVIITTCLNMLKQSYSKYGKIEYSNDKVKTKLND